MYEWPDLRDILQPIRWAIIGGVATRAYMPERVTKDLDILVAAADGQKAISLLQEAGFKVISRLAVPGYLLQAPDGTELDVLFGNFPWLEEGLANPDRDAANYPVISLPYLILLKLESIKAQDMADMATMLGWTSEEVQAEVREIIVRYSPEDSDDLESLIYLGKMETESPTDED